MPESGACRGRTTSVEKNSGGKVMRAQGRCLPPALAKRGSSSVANATQGVQASIWPGAEFRRRPTQISFRYFEKSAHEFLAKLSSRITTCGQRHHKIELLFPQLFERGAEDYVDRGRRGVAGRARSGVQAPGHSLQPIVSVIPALNDATSGGTASGSMDPPRETKRASFFRKLASFVLARRTAQISKKGG